MNHIDKFKRTPLQIAAQSGNLTAVRILLDQKESRGLEIDARSLGGETALYKAASNGHLEIVQLLILHQCNPLIKDVQGYSPRRLAEINHKNSGIDALIKNYKSQS